MYTIIFVGLFLRAHGAFLQEAPILPPPTEEDVPFELPGWFNLAGARVVGGVAAPEGRVPYQVSLRTVFNNHFCAGSILNKRWVLTAAHCTPNKFRFGVVVIVGTSNRLIGGDKYLVEKIISHQDYDSSAIINDVSLIKVKSDIKFSDLVQPIALPTEDTGAGADLFLSGWGRLSYPDTLPVQLQMINLTAMSLERCQKVYNRVSPVYSTQICSLTKTGEGAC